MAVLSVPATPDSLETARTALISTNAPSVPTTAMPMPSAPTPEDHSLADAELGSTTSTTSRATVSPARTSTSASERPTTAMSMPSAPTLSVDSNATADEDSSVTDSSALVMLLLPILLKMAY